eukprot:7186198-Prymnesium_polylepis.1
MRDGSTALACPRVSLISSSSGLSLLSLTSRYVPSPRSNSSAHEPGADRRSSARPAVCAAPTGRYCSSAAVEVTPYEKKAYIVSYAYISTGGYMNSGLMQSCDGERKPSGAGHAREVARTRAVACEGPQPPMGCLLYTSDAADDM